MPDLQYVVSTVFKGDDKTSVALQRMTAQSRVFGASATREFGRAAKSAVRLRDIMGGVLGASVIQRGLGLMQQGIRDLTAEYMDFDQAITGAAAKWGIERGTAAFEELGRVARDTAKITYFTAGEAGKGLDYLAMAGFSASQAMASLNGVTQLAIASGTDLAEASDIASDALSALGLMTSDSTKLTENLNRVNDVFAKTTITSNTNLQMLFESMKMVAPVASGLGVEVEEISAMLGTLANAGIKATMSGTALRNMYLRLTGGTREVTRVLDKYNIQVSDNNGKLRSMIDIIDDVRKATEDLDDETKQAAYTNLFGARAIASATVLMREGATTLHEYEQALRDSGGAAQQLAEDMGKSLPNRLKALQSQVYEVGYQFIDTFKDTIPDALDLVKEKIGNIDIDRLVYSIKEIGRDIKAVYGFAEKWHDEILLIIKTYGVLKGAQLAFNLVASKNPLLWIPTAIAGTYVLVKNWNSFLNTIDEILIKAYEFIDVFYKISRGIWTLGGMVNIGPESMMSSDIAAARARIAGREANAEARYQFSKTGGAETAPLLAPYFEPKKQTVEELFYPGMSHEKGVLSEFVVPKMPEPEPQKVSVDVNFSNIPEGTETKVKTEGPTIGKPLVNTTRSGVQ